MAALAALPASALADSATPGATSAATGPATPAKAPPRPDKVLSNETTFTTWSIADRYIAIRRRPASNAPGFARLKAVTADGFLQSYILLRERFTSTGPWILLRAPGRPNGRTGWVPRKALDSFSVTHMSILVNREAHNLTLYRNGHVVLRFPVGVGKPSTPTPGGHFWITESFSSSDAFYGPWAFATSDFSVLSEWPGGGIVGLHGTNEPALIPGDPSHGCIRLRNSDVRRLIPLVHIGTPLHIV